LDIQESATANGPLITDKASMVHPPYKEDPGRTSAVHPSKICVS